MKLFSTSLSKLAIVPAIVLASATQTHAQSKPNWTWAQSENVTYLQAHATTTDAVGNIYMTGEFHNTITLGTTVLTAAPFAAARFVVKYSASGVEQWAKSFGSKYTCRANDIAIDPSGNVLVTGYFTDSLLFGGNYIRGTSGLDMFLLSYDKNGNTQWARTAGGPRDEHGNTVVADNDGNVYVGGMYGYDNNLVTAHPGVFGSTVLTNNGSGDAFLVKYNSGGYLEWVKGNGGSSRDMIKGLAYDAIDNKIMVVGNFIAGMVYDGMPLTSMGIGDGDIFVAKHDVTGQLAWARSGGSIADDATNAVAVDKNGNVAVALIADGDVTFGSKTAIRTGSTPGSAIYLLKYDAAGNEQWVNHTGGRNAISTSGLDFDKDGAAYVSGRFLGPIMFNGDSFDAPAGASFLAKYHAAGNLDWGTGIIASGGTSGILDVRVDRNTSEVFVAGNFNADSLVLGNHVLYGKPMGAIVMAKMAAFTKVSVQQPAVLTKGALYPVPASTRLYTTVSTADYANVLIYDVNGRVVYNAPTPATIQLPLLQTGTYFVQFSGSAGIATEKILIQQ